MTDQKQHKRIKRAASLAGMLEYQLELLSTEGGDPIIDIGALCHELANDVIALTGKIAGPDDRRKLYKDVDERMEDK